jgi:hypothetical protein
VSLDIGNVSFESDHGQVDPVYQLTPSSNSKQAPAHIISQQDAGMPEQHSVSQSSPFRVSKAKVTDSESPSNLPRMDFKLSIHAGSSTPSLSAIKRKTKQVVTTAKVSPLPVFEFNAVAWGVSANSDADADSVPSTTTSTWTSTSVPSASSSDHDADSESAPVYRTEVRPRMVPDEIKLTGSARHSSRDVGHDFHVSHVATLTSDASDGASNAMTSPSEQWGTIVDAATAKSPVSKFNSSWCVPSPTRRRTSVTPSILHHGVQPSPFNNPAVFANSPHDSSMESSSRIDEDVTVNMGYFNPTNDVSMRTAKDSPYLSQSPTDMDISAEKEPDEVAQLPPFAGVHHVDRYLSFARADSSSSAASSVIQEDDSFVAPRAAAVPRMDFLKELLAVRKKASPVTLATRPLSLTASHDSIASSVLHEAAMKVSNFAPSRDATASHVAVAGNFQDELRKRLSAVKANTQLGASVTSQPPITKDGPKAESPYVQKSVSELRKQLLISKAAIGGASLTAKSNSCTFALIFIILTRKMTCCSSSQRGSWTPVS